MKVFTSERCPPCKILKKILREKKVEFEEVNIDTPEGLEEARRYDIRALPTIIKDGKTYVGLPLDRKKLEEIIC